MKRLLVCLLSLLPASLAVAATQQYQEISLSNRQELRQKFYSANTINSFRDVQHAVGWISQQSYLLQRKIPDERKRRELLRMIHYEATRYQLDPDMVLALIEVESGFNRFALSHVGASGLMQVMPFWKGLIGRIQIHYSKSRLIYVMAASFSGTTLISRTTISSVVWHAITAA
jgi:soluble lytic murein transglycosylase-like protein